MAVQIIAQVGDTHSLKFQDMGQRRFLRLGASEKNPDLMRGTVHTGAIFGGPDGRDARSTLGLLGLTLFDPGHAYADDCFACYFITGAIAYLVEEEGSEFLGILASIREIPSEDNAAEDEVQDAAEEAEFERQYRFVQRVTADDDFDAYQVYADSSVARELDAAIGKYARDRQPGLDGQRTERVAELTRFQEIQGGLSARQRAELDRLLNPQRVADAAREPISLDGEDAEPQMLTGRLG